MDRFDPILFDSVGGSHRGPIVRHGPLSSAGRHGRHMYRAGLDVYQSLHGILADHVVAGGADRRRHWFPVYPIAGTLTAILFEKKGSRDGNRDIR